jgi:hypothetical protein
MAATVYDILLLFWVDETVATTHLEILNKNKGIINKDKIIIVLDAIKHFFRSYYI